MPRDVLEERREVGPVGVEGEHEGRRHARLLQRLHRAAGRVAAEVVAGMDERDPGHADAGQVRHRFLRLAPVGGAHVEDPWVHRLVQRGRAGGRRHQRHLQLGKQRPDRLGRRRAVAQEQRHHAPLPDELAHVVGGQRRLPSVVQRDEPHRLPLHAAAAVEVLQVQLRAVGRLLHQRAHRAAEAGRLAHEHLRRRGDGRPAEHERSQEASHPAIVQCRARVAHPVPRV